MTGFSISTVGNLHSAQPAAAAVSREFARGTASAALADGAGPDRGLVFAVGSAGQTLSGVTVTIRDGTGVSVTSIYLPSLHGLQALLWRPGPGLAAGVFSAYWEGQALAAQQ